MKRLLLGLLVLGVACGDDGGGETTGSGSSGSSTSDSTTSATSTTSTSASTSTGMTTDPSTSASTDPSTTSGGSSGGGDVDPSILAMCQCLLINCHDAYHLEYGLDEIAADAACNDDGASIPLEGSGDTVECRLNACSMSDCEAGFGKAAPCM